MKLKIIQCDKCGKRIMANDIYTRILLTRFIDIIVQSKDISYDLCSKCMEKFFEFFNNINEDYFEKLEDK